MDTLSCIPVKRQPECKTTEQSFWDAFFFSQELKKSVDTAIVSIKCLKPSINIGAEFNSIKSSEA